LRPGDDWLFADGTPHASVIDTVISPWCRIFFSKCVTGFEYLMHAVGSERLEQLLKKV